MPHKQHTILLVDDDEAVLLLLSDLLSPSYEILTAGDGQEALQLIQDEPNRERIHLIISDHRMPGLRGSEFLNQTLSFLPYTKQILLTGFTDVDAIIELVNEGQLYRFILKPYDLNDMQTTIKRALEAYDVEAHNRQLVNELQLLNANLERKVEERTQQAEQTLQELEHALEELRQVNATKDKFFSIVAHDLRNTLQAFVLSSETLVAYIDIFDHSRILELAKNMNKMASNLYGLLENLLEWGKLQKGQIQLFPESCKLQHIVRHTINLFIEKAAHKQIVISTDIPKKTLVFADKNLLKTVLRNLLSNALKFTREGGHISINASEVEEQIQISVQDNGMGFAQDKVQNILLLARQFTHKGTAQETGTGLGLPLCQELLLSAKSTLVFDSIPNKGTTVHFLLPSSEREKPDTE